MIFLYQILLIVEFNDNIVILCWCKYPIIKYQQIEKYTLSIRCKKTLVFQQPWFYYLNVISCFLWLLILLLCLEGVLRDNVSSSKRCSYDFSLNWKFSEYNFHFPLSTSIGLFIQWQHSHILFVFTIYQNIST